MRKQFDPLGNLFFKELYDECDDLAFKLRHEPDREAEENLERRYKIVVMTLLPIICSRVRAIFFTLSSMLTIFAIILFKALTM